MYAIGEPRLMLSYIDTEQIYAYFQYVETFVNLDFSCSDFYVSDNDYTKLKKVGKKKAAKLVNKKLVHRKLLDPRGGKNKNKNITKTKKLNKIYRF
jgi:hypothetical protein